MTVAVYAQKFGFENRLGLHYSRFQLSRRSIISPNQLLGGARPAENRRFPRRIREVGLDCCTHALSRHPRECGGLRRLRNKRKVVGAVPAALDSRSSRE